MAFRDRRAKLAGYPTARFGGEGAVVLTTRTTWYNPRRGCAFSARHDPARVLLQFAHRRRWVRVRELDRPAAV